ncbi:MAG: hypothetical protein Q4F95_02745 [Oscillospiraceae bacterium]|nr:hypothetical protein [Oscillospiraceae bacterium]
MLKQEYSQYSQIECINKICHLSNFKEIVLAYKENLRILEDYIIFKSTDDDFSVDLYKMFRNIEGIEYQLLSPFKNGKANYISSNSLKRYYIYGDLFTTEERCVSFDTQTVSYIDRYYHNKESSLPQNFQNVIDIIKMQCISVDTLPYTCENIMLSGTDFSSVEDTLFSFEKIFYNKKKSDYFCRSQVKKTISLYNKKNTYITTVLVRLYNVIYCILLKIVYIQFRYNKLKDKINLLCDFMNHDLCAIMIPELILAKHYFEKGQKYRFFGKIQKNRIDVLENLKNMAWDIFHLRMNERECLYFNKNKTDILIPYFYTYDKRLSEIKKCYDLDAIALCVETQESYQFYSNINEVQGFIEYLFTPDLISKRRKEHETVDINLLVKSCEEHLISLLLDNE